LGSQYRVIYRVVADQVMVQVVDINAHEYRRR
jgi:mRNA-degrading endonuclease RelE of RelBE toxin-antitoxin system